MTDIDFDKDLLARHDAALAEDQSWKDLNAKYHEADLSNPSIRDLYEEEAQAHFSYGPPVGLTVQEYDQLLSGLREPF